MSFTTWNSASTLGAASSTTIQSWGSAISAAFATAGLTQTTDTGQINWSTVTTPTLANTAAGYEIWRFTDSLQATAPIFLKIEYGNGTSVGYPGLWITVGTGSDGVGNITGVIRARLSMSTLNSGTVTPNFMTYDGASLYFLLQAGLGTGYQMGFLIERSRDSSGVATNKGVCVAWANGSAAANWYVHNYATPALYTYWSGISPVTAPYYTSGTGTPTMATSVATDASSAPAIPIYVYTNGVPAWTLQSAVLVLPADQANAMTITVNGSPRTYRGVMSFVGTGLICVYTYTQGYYWPAMLVS